MESFTNETWFAYFPEDYRWSAAVLILLGTAPMGSSDIGEVDRVCKALRRNVGNDEAWFEEWTRMGEEVEARARQALALNRGLTASAFFFRASMYYQMGERFRQPKDRKALDIFARGVSCFREAARYTDAPYIEPVEIPYENGKSLPALFVKPSAADRRPFPTVVFSTGLTSPRRSAFSSAGCETWSGAGSPVFSWTGPATGKASVLETFIFDTTRRSRPGPPSITWKQEATSIRSGSASWP